MSKPAPTKNAPTHSLAGVRAGSLGVRFVQRVGSTLNAHVQFHCWVIDGVFVAGANGQVQFAEAAALRPEDLAAVRRPVQHELPGEGPRLSGDRRQSDCCQPPTRLRSHHRDAMQRRPSWFARAGHLDAADARDMASGDHGGGFWLRPLRFHRMVRSASKAPTAPAWNGCCAIARGRPLPWSASNGWPTVRSSIASTSRSPMGAPSCGIRPWN